jgi:hypothetical protein
LLEGDGTRRKENLGKLSIVRPSKVSIEAFKRHLVRAQNKLVVTCCTARLGRKKQTIELVRLGSSYGGWWIPRSFVCREDFSSSAVISVGLGFDVTFDRELLELGLTVIGLDPLPASCEFSEKQLSDFSKSYIEHSGLGTKTGFQDFFPPKVETHDSWSLTNVQETNMQLVKSMPTITISDLLSKYQSLLPRNGLGIKMDIEGGEILAIPDLMSVSNRFDFIAIEMDFLSLIPFIALRRRLNAILVCRKIIRDFNQHGFTLCKTELFNFLWVRLID